MLKGKLGAGANLAFRFNASDEELEVELIPEQLPLSPKLKTIPERDDGSGNEDTTLTGKGGLSPPPSPNLHLNMPVPEIAESSPVKEYLNKLSRRSSSLDTSEATDAAWNLLADIKGKISKTVEDKITEIKHENRLLHKKLSKRARSLQLIGVAGKDEEKDKMEETLEDDDQKKDDILNMKAVQDGFRGLFARNKPESFDVVPEEEAPKPPMKSQRSASLIDLDTFVSTKLTSSNSVTAIKSPTEPSCHDLRKRHKKFPSPIRLAPKLGLIPHENVLPTPEVEAAEEADELLTKSDILEDSEEAQTENKLQNVEAILAQNQESVLTKNQLWLGILIISAIFLCWVAPFAAGFVLGISAALFGIHKALEAPKVCFPRAKIKLQTVTVKEHSALLCVEGWMYELISPYRPEKRGKARPVYVRVQGPILHILVPRHDKGPNKYASWDEPVSAPLPASLLQRRRLTLEGAEVRLEPELSAKRLWFRKYPIKIVLDSRNLVTSGEITPESDLAYHDATDNSLGGNSSQSEDDFEQVSLEMCTEKEIYLFARSDREKEDWFRAFSVASKGHIGGNSPIPTPDCTSKPAGWIDVSTEDASAMFSSEISKENNLAEMLKQHMAAYMIPVKELDAELEDGTGQSELGNVQVLWFNAFVARIMFDFLRQAEWAEMVKNRLQKKLAKIKMPHFMEGLCITHLNLGKNVPRISRVGTPFTNSRGLWVFLDLKYEGGIQMSIQTKLCVGKGFVSDIADSVSIGRKLATKSSEDSDEESIPSEDESEEEGESDAATDDSTLKSVVSKITSSKYFQQAAESKYVRKALENVSNIRLLLEVELQALEGTLALNIPPPPSNRLWYGFKVPPRLEITARPKLGEREVNYSHVTSWIEKKLEREFQDLLVLPNMDDLIIPVMDTTLP